MPIPTPTHCRSEAFHLLADQVPAIETTAGLMSAAVAVSLHATPAEDTLARVDAEIEELAASIRSRVRGSQEQAILAHAHEVLFEEHGFMGDSDEYYRPENGYLLDVLLSKRGLPITLVLVYKLVLERCGLRVLGINAPGHFLASVRVHGSELLVDPFFGGIALTVEEVRQRVATVTGRPPGPNDEFLLVASHRRWILRMLRNLRETFARRRRRSDQAAMIELSRLLGDAV